MDWWHAIDHPPRTGWIPQVLPQGRLCCRGVGAFLPDSGWFRDPIDLICRSNHVDVFESLAEKKLAVFFRAWDVSLWLLRSALIYQRGDCSPTNYGWAVQPLRQPKRTVHLQKWKDSPINFISVAILRVSGGKSSNGGCSIAFYLISNSLDEASLAAWKLSHHCCQLDDLSVTCCTSPSTSQKSRHVPLQIWRTCSCLSSEESGYCTRPLSASRNWSFIDPYTHCIQ